MNDFLYMTDFERIKKVVEYFNISSLRRFSSEIGLNSVQTLYDIKSGKHGISKDVAYKIQARYLNINPVWLLTGEGEMIRTAPTTSIVTGDISGNGNNVVAGNGNTVGNTTHTVHEPIIIPTSIMQKPESDSKEWVESKEAQQNADRLQIADILRRTDMVWTVEDEAMQPTLFQGEYVLIKEMHDEAKIINGRVYAMDTVYHGNVIRRVYDEGETYRLTPINKDGFSEIVIDKKKGLNRRYRILCHLSTELSIVPDLDEERQRQDKLIAQQERLIEQQGRLIGIIEKNNQ